MYFIDVFFDLDRLFLFFPEVDSSEIRRTPFPEDQGSGKVQQRGGDQDFR
jgi:hypothetical protein